MKGYTIYCYPFIACHSCFVQLVQAGITRFVAPKPSKDILSRWSESIDKVKQYAKEMNTRGNFAAMKVIEIVEL